MGCIFFLKIDRNICFIRCFIKEELGLEIQGSGENTQAGYSSVGERS